MKEKNDTLKTTKEVLVKIHLMNNMQVICVVFFKHKL